MSDEEIYQEVLAILSDYFNGGNIPKSVEDKGGYLLGVATVFMQWGKSITKRAKREMSKDDTRPFPIQAEIGRHEGVGGHS